jgi:SnoaL-like domain
VDIESAARRWADIWRRAWPESDADVIVALYADEAVYRALAFREPESPCGYLERVLPEGTDVECWFGDPIVSGDRAAVEWWGSWVEEGRELTLAGTTVLRFDAEGQVIDHRDYWNQVARREAPYAGWGR